MSFSAEMKDFINAYQKGQSINASKTDQDYKEALTDAQKKKTARDNDPDQLELQDQQARANLERTKASTALAGEQAKNAGVSREYTRALTNRVNNPLQPDTSSGLLPSTPGIGPVAPNGAQPAAVPDLQPRTDLYKNGGRIKAYAGGGAIPDNDDDEGEDAAVGGDGDPDDRALEMRAGRGATNIQGLNGVVSPQLVHDAVKGGYQHLIQAAGLSGGVRSPRQQAAARALAQGVGALSSQEMKAAGDAVDPEHKLSQSQRNMAALGSVYQYWVKQGDPDKAQKVAAQMLQHMRLASQQYAAIAAHAAEQGNMDLAAKAGVQAYANVPDGKDMMITAGKDGQLQYHYTDENGKTIDKNLISPQDFAAKAMGLARGGFDQAILSAAGQREDATAATGKATKGPKGDKVMDMKNRDEMLGGALQSAQDQWSKKNKGSEPDQQYWDGIRDAATHIMQQNPNATPHEAINAAVELSTTSGGNPAPTFSTTSQDGMNTIKLKNGNTISLDDDRFNALMQNRAANIKAGQDKEATDKAAADASSARWSRIREGAQKVGGAIADDARQFGGEVSAMVPDELKQRLPGAVDSAKRAIDDGLGVLTKPVGPQIQPLTDAIGHGVQQGVQAALAALQRSGQAQAAPATQQDNSGAIPSSPDTPGLYPGS